MVDGILSRLKLTRELYTEGTLNKALDRLQNLPQDSKSVDSLLRDAGINKDTLQRTVRKGMEEYVDGLVDLRHGWKPKMMDGSPEEKEEIYDGLAATIKRMDEFSEPYVSGMRLISDVALRELVASPNMITDETKQKLEQALQYEGARYNFDERTVTVTPTGGHAYVHDKGLVHSDDPHSQIAQGFMHLKDLLNLMEDVTTPDVYKNVKNTNEFPEARIGKSFEVTHEIEKTIKQITEGYEFLSRTDKSKIETLDMLKSLEGDKLTRATQFYAALQFNEKPWDKAYKASITSLIASVAGAAYSFRPFLENVQTSGLPNTLSNYTNDTLLFLASATWTILSGLAVYGSTDAGPKSAKWFRKLDEKFIKYKWV